jgi:hypothetical protein
LETDLSEPGGFNMIQGHAGDSRSLELASADNSQSPGSGWVMSPIVAVVKIIVDNNHGPVVPAEGAPADIIIAIVPMNPGRSPMIGGDPVPAQSHSPVPAPVVVSTPAPGLIRNPAPAARRIPQPSSVIIGPPILVIHAGDPDVAVRPFIGPIAVGGELIFIVGQLRGQVALGDILILQRIPVFIPVVKIIAIVGE